jgi:hypothetical protein
VAESLGTSAERFAAFSEQSVTAAVDNSGAASAQLAAAGDALPALRIVEFIGGLVIAALVLAGYGQRLREYR